MPRSERTMLQAHRIIRSKARTFYAASWFLPSGIRRDVYIIYAFFRTVDDLVDERSPLWSRSEVERELECWHRALSGHGWDHPLLADLSRVIDRHNIPIEYLRMVLRGAYLDLDLQTLDTRAELEQYSILMAGSVGMVMAHMLGARGQAALDAACGLGVAMQITNVLRDVGEDLQRGRIYLPLDDLTRAGCSPDTLRAGEVTPGLRFVMRELMAHARLLYRQGAAAVGLLDPSAQFAITLAATLYARILDKIEANDFDVFTRRAHLGTVEKCRLTVPAYVQSRRIVLGRLG